MRLNNHSDTGDWCQAIAARCDLESDSEFPFGSVDCKSTDDKKVGDHKAWIQDGPTYELEPPFSWANWPQYQPDYIGMPLLWNFTWVYYDPAQNFSTYDSVFTSIHNK